MTGGPGGTVTGGLVGRRIPGFAGIGVEGWWRPGSLMTVGGCTLITFAGCFCCVRK